MDILSKIGKIEDEAILQESGIQNMKALAKQYKKAKIFFHKDLDGVTSAVAMKKYLEDNRIKVVEAEPIQYGGEEYTVKKTKPDVMNVLVDFAHGKPMMTIHTDHHDGQVGVNKGTSTAFVATPSNVQSISQVMSPGPIFPQRDIDIISTVDSADFSRHGLTPDDIMRATFTYDKAVDVKKNHQMMGLACNKLILSYKNKPGFLAKLVMAAKPSLMSLFNVTTSLAKADGYKAPEDIEAHGENYKQQRADKKMDDGVPADIPRMKMGQSFMNGTTIFQKGGGFMGGKNQYDRYTIFTQWPDAHFLITQWPMGLVQVAGNPFSKLSNPHHLGDLVMKKVMPKFKGKLQSEDITLDRIKYEFERDIAKKKIQGAVGFTWHDFVALYEKSVKGLQSKNDWWPNMIQDITNKPYAKLSTKQKGLLKKISVPAWDVIMAGSGGHKSITNMSGLNFLKDTKTMMNDISIEISKMMADKRLK
jgi:hypothetical protein